MIKVFAGLSRLIELRERQSVKQNLSEVSVSGETKGFALFNELWKSKAFRTLRILKWRSTE